MTPKKTNNKYVSDYYSRQAKKDHFPARSVYKLKEIQQKFHLIKPGDKVLDLGCAPGSWARYAGEVVGPHGMVTGIDLKAVGERMSGRVRLLTGDVLLLSEKPAATLSSIIGLPYQAVISDMAPATTGRREVDTARSLALCRAALAIARKVLAPGGFFVCKVFQGEDSSRFIRETALHFERHKLFKPQSCRRESMEIYLIAFGRKQEEN